jgi:O-antigen/teichoic acid export membrane protein
MGRKKIATQFAWVSIGRLAGALIQAVTMLLLARDLGPKSFGLFSAAFGTAIVFQASLDLGVATLVLKERSANAQSTLIYSALRLTDSLGLALFILAATLLLGFGLLVDPFFLLLLPLAAWAAAERQADVWLSVPLADGDARINTQNLLLRRVATLLLYVGGLSTGIQPAFAFSAGMAITAVLSYTFVRKLVIQRINTEGVRTPVRAIVRQSWPYWLNSIGVQARNLDTLIVSTVAGAGQAGYYAATSRATGPLRILSTSMATVMLPASTSKSPRDTRRLLRVVGIFAVFSCALYGSLVVFVPVAVELFLGEIYHEAILPLQIVLAGLVFAGLASLFTSMLQGVGLQLFVAKTAVITTIVCLIFVSFGGSTAGAIGAAIALAASFVVQAIILATQVIRYTRESSRSQLSESLLGM